MLLFFYIGEDHVKHLKEVKKKKEKSIKTKAKAPDLRPSERQLERQKVNGRQASTKEQQLELMKKRTVVAGALIIALCTYFFAYVGTISASQNMSLMDAFSELFMRLIEFRIFFLPNRGSLWGLAGIGIGAIVFFPIRAMQVSRFSFLSDEVAGTASFMTPKAIQNYNRIFIDPEPEPILNVPVKASMEGYSANVVLSQNFLRPINLTGKINGNNNIFVLGGSGAGKSRFFIKPNMLQMNASYVVTDPSGELLDSVGKTLQEHGYKIKVFNISDQSYSNSYNPFKYIREGDSASVTSLIECFISNTTQGEGGGDNQFFVDAEKLLYAAFIFYLIEFGHDDSKKNFSSLTKLLESMKVNEQDPSKCESDVDKLFDKLPRSSLSWQHYNLFKLSPGKTMSSILISCATRLRPFLTPQVVNLTSTDELELDKLGDEKIALFIIAPPTDQTFSFLAAMLYSQLFQTLYHKGDVQQSVTGSPAMKIPVRCLMDEFANIGVIPDFVEILSTVRKYNISVAPVLQDLSQLQAMYPDTWQSIIGNCSSTLFLGTTAVDTLKYYSEALGVTTIRVKSQGMSVSGGKSSNENYSNTSRPLMTPDELSLLPDDECIVMSQGFRPVRDRKYDYPTHPYYTQTADADIKNAFNYRENPYYDNRLQGRYASMVKAKIEAERIARQNSRHGKVEFVKLSEVNLGKKSVRELVDSVRVSPSLAQKTTAQCLSKCMTAAISALNKSLTMIWVNDIPTSYLKDIVQSVAEKLHIERLIIVVDNSISKEDTELVAIAYDRVGKGTDDLQKIVKVCGNLILRHRIKEPFAIYTLDKSKFTEAKQRLQDTFVKSTTK